MWKGELEKYVISVAFDLLIILIDEMERCIFMISVLKSSAGSFKENNTLTCDSCYANQR